MVTPRTSTAVSMLSPCDGAKFIRSTYLRIPKRWRAGWSFKPSPASKRPLPNKLLANQLGQHFGNGLGWKIGTFASCPRLYTQVYSPGGNLKQNKHWRVTLEPRIARYRRTLLLPNMRGAHSRTRLDNNRHDRPGRCRWHSPVFLWCVDKNSKSLRFQRVSDHWALAGSTSAARVLHCRLWGLQPTDFCIHGHVVHHTADRLGGACYPRPVGRRVGACYPRPPV